MIKSLESWLSEEVEPMKKKSMKYLSEQFFHREIQFTKKLNSNIFYSGASGTIINAQKGVFPNEFMTTEVKGKRYSLNEIYKEKINFKDKKYLVIDIYMSFYDQHFNYIPYPGMIYQEELLPIKSYNLPMLAMEKEVLKGVVNPELTLDYLYSNGRMLSTITSPKLGGEYYVLQIGDFDVNKILSFVSNGEALYGTKKFGKITLGSQFTLIIPHKKHYNLKFRNDVKVGMHCEATDALIDIDWVED